DEEAVTQLLDQGSNEVAPHFEEMVTLVEHKGPGSRALQPIDQYPAVRVEQTEQFIPITTAGDEPSSLPPEAGQLGPIMDIARFCELFDLVRRLPRRESASSLNRALPQHQCTLVEFRILVVKVAERLVSQNGERCFQAR